MTNTDTTTVHTLDPHTVGVITAAGEEIEAIRFDFYSEDPAEWERQADAALTAAGWQRTGPWQDNTAPVARRIRSDEDYAEAAREYAQRCREIVDARRARDHATAARLARITKPLEDALALYDATNGRR